MRPILSTMDETLDVEGTAPSVVETDEVAEEPVAEATYNPFGYLSQPPREG